MMFKFTCKTHPELHSAPVYRPREKTSEGTANLLNGMRSCLEARGIKKVVVEDDKGVLSYSKENFRALQVIRTAKYPRPFNAVKDEEYRREVQMLRPGAEQDIPHPSTLSRDLNFVYLQLSYTVMAFFAVCYPFSLRSNI